MPKVLTLLRHNIKNVENKIRVISLARLSPTVFYFVTWAIIGPYNKRKIHTIREKNSILDFAEIPTATGKRNQITILMCLQASNRNL